MSNEPVIRKLTAILYADVAGYSRMTGEDEVGTHRQLSTGLDLISGRIKDSGGRVVHYAGDAVLGEFQSVVAAVETAVAVQAALSDRFADKPKDRRLQFRIGVNLGEVIVDRDDIYGDGVNVAARLESLADPSGVCVSGAVFEQVNGKLDIGFEDMGDQEVKNIAAPVRAYRIVTGHSMLTDAPPLQDKPSIAVLPFDNMSGDPEQEYFSDGITEDIITALSRSPWLFVIARNSTFTYKDQRVDVKQVAGELGVRYVLEGSVRKSGERVRVTAQLIDGATGGHVWAEKYDGKLEDVFDLQDLITQNVVASLHTQITIAEGDLAERTPQRENKIWDLTARGWKLFYELNPDSLKEAKGLLEKAIELDPSSCQATWLLSGVLSHEKKLGYAEDPDAAVKRALELAKRAVALDDGNEYAHWNLGSNYNDNREHGRAISEHNRAIEINPNCSLARGSLGTSLSYAGDPDESIRNNEIAIRSNPRDITIFFRYIGIARAHYVAGRYDEAVDWATRTITNKPDYFLGHLILAASLAKLDRLDEARAAVAEYLKYFPNASVTDALKEPYKDETINESLMAGLRRAGMPE